MVVVAVVVVVVYYLLFLTSYFYAVKIKSGNYFYSGFSLGACLKLALNFKCAHCVRWYTFGILFTLTVQ